MIREIRTILLVEDSAADAEMTIDALREAKLANPVVHVEDGVEALDYLFSRSQFENREPGLFASVVRIGHQNLTWPRTPNVRGASSRTPNAWLTG